MAQMIVDVSDFFLLRLFHLKYDVKNIPYFTRKKETKGDRSRRKDLMFFSHLIYPEKHLVTAQYFRQPLWELPNPKCPDQTPGLVGFSFDQIEQD